MSVRIFTYECPRCQFTIPAKSRAKSRFDSFCPRCNQRITIWWPSRRKSVWDDRRGRKRVVAYFPVHTWPEAVERAQEANSWLQRRLHSQSIFNLKKMNDGFVQASKLNSFQNQQKKGKKD